MPAPPMDPRWGRPFLSVVFLGLLAAPLYLMQQPSSETPTHAGEAMELFGFNLTDAGFREVAQVQAAPVPA